MHNFEETVSSHIMLVLKLNEKYQAVNISWHVFSLDSIDTKKFIMSMKETLPFDIALYDNEVMQLVKYPVKG